MHHRSRIRLVELVAMAAILAASIAVWGPGQEFTNVNEGKGFDGLFYFETAEQIRAGSLGVVMPPYGFRLGHIVIAAYAPIDDLLHSFYYTNLISIGVGGLLLAVWLQLRLRYRSMRFLAIFIFGWAIFGPLRLTTLYPTNAEPFTFALVMANFLVIDAYLRTHGRHWYAMILLLAVLGSVTRELALIPVLALAFADVKIDWTPLRRLPRVWALAPALLVPFLRKNRLKLYLPLAIGLTGMVLVRQILPAHYPFSAFAHAADGWTGTNDLRFLASLIAMLGPIALVALFRPAFLMDWFSRRAFYAAYVGITLFLGYTNQPDERYFIYLLPILFLLIEATLDRYYKLGRDAVFWSMTFIFTAVAIRAYLPAPPFGIQFPLLPWWREAFSRFLPHSSDLFGVWIFLSPSKTALASLAVFLIMGWLLWLRAEACSKPEDTVVQRDKTA